MSTEPLLSLRGVRDGVRILVQKGAQLSQVEEQIIVKVSANRNFFRGGKVMIELDGDYEAEACVALCTALKEKCELEMVEVRQRSYTNKGEFANLRSGLIPIEGFAHLRQGNALYHAGNVVSGDKLEYPGSIVVFGTVEKDAEISAGGHIVVLGHLLGTARAGQAGDSTATITALMFRPVQVAIGNVLATAPQQAGPLPDVAEVASLDVDGTIVILPCITQNEAEAPKKQGGFMQRLFGSKTKKEED